MPNAWMIHGKKKVALATRRKDNVWGMRTACGTGVQKHAVFAIVCTIMLCAQLYMIKIQN